MGDLGQYPLSCILAQLQFNYFSATLVLVRGSLTILSTLSTSPWLLVLCLLLSAQSCPSAVRAIKFLEQKKPAYNDVQVWLSCTLVFILYATAVSMYSAAIVM